MKNSLSTRNLISSILITLLLLYFMVKSPSPKIIFIPFLICSISMAGKSIARLLNKKSKKNGESVFTFGIVISAALVVIALVAGIILLVLGIKDLDVGLIFAGTFFTFGAFTFVLAALTMQGCFDKMKIDVFGMYIGVLFVVIGIGFIALKYRESYSILETIQSFGLWIIIPIMMAVAGMIQIVKCLRNRK